ncbi:hypothetical protein I8752_26150 [Nostocaceae cyanobacterium CENA369]|uniref:Uncharacterized protein n=1 Tax=Dendronalium phyllosphericum CENA369 TaxID=1725256 RepID=A0A8J7I904_9NOST|nr:hypothetical protein [Dendronalium phyllosphericum]MBH8576408.1 hypothetical protein [Dendronalium phyllosphericum CENA369]
MLKPIISYITKAYKINRGTPLQIVSFALNFERDDIYAVIKCIFDCGEPADIVKTQRVKNFYRQYLTFNIDNKIYNLYKMDAVIQEKETNTDICKINDQSKSLSRIAGGKILYQRYILTTWEEICEKIKISMKLYSSILDKCRYTSLKLAVQTAARMAYPIANFRTCNLVKVGSSDNNK